MPTKKPASQPRRQRAPSRTLSHAPTAVLLAAAAAALLLAVIFSAAAPSAPAQHMQHLFHRITSPLKHASAPAFARIRSTVLPPNAATYTTTMSSANTNDENKKKAAADSTVDAGSFHPGSSTNPHNEPVLPLPAPGEGEALKLDLGGDGVKLDALGPMVVNADGSLSRIANWDKMAEIEKRNTLRVLGKRNKARLAALRGEEGEGK